MISRRTSSRRVIPAAAEDEPKYPEFDAAYKDHMQDVQLGAFDVLFCPKRQSCCAYFGTVIVKVIEYSLIIYVFLAAGGEKKQKISYNKSILDLILVFFFFFNTFWLAMLPLMANKNMTACHRQPGKYLLWMVLEVLEVMALSSATLTLLTPYVGKEEFDIEFILNGLGLLFIAEVDESCVTSLTATVPYGGLHYNVLKAYYEVCNEYERRGFIDPTVKSFNRYVGDGVEGESRAKARAEELSQQQQIV